MAGPWEQYSAPATEAAAPAQAGPWASYASEPATAPAAPKRSVRESITQGAGNLIGGIVRGAGSIGSTILAPADMINDALAGKGLSLESNRARRAEIDEGLRMMGAEPDSLLYQGGKIAGEIAGTAGVPGVVARGAAGVGAAPALVNAIRTSGMSTGAAPGALNMATRMAGGAAAGGASAALVDPENAGAGAAIGGVLPPVLSGVGGAARYAGRGVRSLVQPFTEAGRDQIAGNVLRNFADGGPVAINSAEIIPGSVPTLAEATGNAGLAGLQRVARDVRPNAFVDREALNASARLAAFDRTAGDASQLSAARALRGDTADDLYTAALGKDASENMTPYVKGQITQLLKRPSINQASKEAQRLAMERGEKPAAAGSMTALHDVKTILDDKISEAVRRGAGGEAKSLGATKDKLLSVMERLSPEYGAARETYAQQSAPINAMESLQGLKLTDARGNITLAKVKNAIEGLERQRSAPGVSAAKSVTGEQLDVLRAIRSDLEREGNVQLGRSAGSNTFQNLATDNILNNVTGNTIGAFLGRRGVGDVLGQGGRLIYSGANEKIKNRIVDAVLDPNSAAALMNAAPQNSMASMLPNGAEQLLYRSAPVAIGQ